MKWPRVILLIVVAALVAWAWVALHPGPERLIRRRLDKLAHVASFGPNQGYLSKLAGAQSLADFCATNIDVNVDVPGRQELRLAGREDVQQAALALRASVAGLAVTFPDVTIVVNADKESAVADLTVQARVAGEHDMIVQEVKLTMQKIEGQWLIVKAETVRTLR
ncbi:MAG TPA: hypothetical protein VGR14_01060 [Verrucomicrobiae bacterium]|jgi:hypothetical protein|nr:hypothetical protein [Verrucomicrobiae bacterium]